MKAHVKITALLISLWMFLMSAGVNVYTHYCDGAFEGTSILFAQEQCEHENEAHHTSQSKQEKSCCMQAKESLDCCINDTDRISIEDDYLISNFNFTVPVFIAVHTYTLFNLPVKRSIEHDNLVFNQIIIPPPLSISIEGITQCFRL